MISFPYTSVKKIVDSTPTYDRAINSKVKRNLNELLYTKGIAPNSGSAFKVIAGNGMSVKVQCNGSWAHVGGNLCYEESTERVIVMDAADSTYDRFDAVVIRNNISTSVRKADIYVVKGTPASSPKIPDLTNTPEIQEICLAAVLVSRNSSNISQSKITDTRLDPEKCGIFTNAFGEIDTKPFFTQLESLIKDLEKEISGVKDGSAYMLSSVYDPNKVGMDIFEYSKVFSVTFRLDGWQQSGSKWTQTVDCPGMKAEYNTDAPWFYKTGVAKTDEELQSAFNIIYEGNLETLERAVKATVSSKPTCDVKIYMRRSVTE